MTDDTPELIRDTPDSIAEDFIPKIAEKLGVTVSMLQALPNDVLQMMRQIYIQTVNDPAAFQTRMQQLFRMQDISPIKTVEETVEQNANCIDGIINNLPLEAESAHAAETRSSEPFHFTKQRLAEIAAAARRAHIQHETAEMQQDELERKQTGG